MVVRERLTEPRLTGKPRSFSNLPSFLDLNGMKIVVPGRQFIKKYISAIFKFVYFISNGVNWNLNRNIGINEKDAKLNLQVLLSTRTKKSLKKSEQNFSD